MEENKISDKLFNLPKFKTDDNFYIIDPNNKEMILEQTKNSYCNYDKGDQGINNEDVISKKDSEDGIIIDDVDKCKGNNVDNKLLVISMKDEPKIIIKLPDRSIYIFICL